MNISMKITLDGLIQALRLDVQRLADAAEFGPRASSEPRLEPRRPTRTMRSDDDDRRRE